MKTWRAKVTIRNSISFYLSIHTQSTFFPFVCVISRVFLVLFASSALSFSVRLASSESSITTKYEKFGVPNYDDDGDGDDDDEGRCFLFDTSTMLEVGSVCVCVCVFSFCFSSI